MQSGEGDSAERGGLRRRTLQNGAEQDGPRAGDAGLGGFGGAALRGAAESAPGDPEGAEPAVEEHPGVLLQVQRPLLRQDGEARAAHQPRDAQVHGEDPQRAQRVACFA